MMWILEPHKSIHPLSKTNITTHQDHYVHFGSSIISLCSIWYMKTNCNLLLKSRLLYSNSCNNQGSCNKVVSISFHSLIKNLEFKSYL